MKKTIMLILFPLQIIANPICSQKVKKNESYVKLQAYKESQLEIFANRKEVASKADQTLSRLISAKSPMVGAWINKRNLNNASEVEIVKRWRRYYAENFVLGRFPQKEKKVNQLIEELIDGTYNHIFPKEKKKQLEALFSEAKEKSLQRIRNFPIDGKVKKQILARVSGLRLYWMDKFSTSKFKKQPLEVFSWGVAYSPVENEINVGLEALQYSSEETLFSVFAHEIGHSFDSCRWGAFFEGKNPFQKVLSCLRSQSSVGALRRDDSKMTSMIQKGKLSNELATALKLHPTCNKIQYPPIGVQADQTPESFADWFSAEVVADSKYVNLNLRSDLCRTKKLNKGSSYPANEERLKKIYLAHPKIKKKLKLKYEATYCSL